MVLSLVAVLAIAAPAAASPEVVIALHPGGPGPTVLERIAERPKLSPGLLGATQGPYSVRQTLLDMTQGARISKSGYDPRGVPNLSLERTDTGWRIFRWDEAVERAESAPADLEPGWLADLAGGIAFVGVGEPDFVRGRVLSTAATAGPGLEGPSNVGRYPPDLTGRVPSHVEAVLAADRTGKVAEVSLGRENDIPERVRAVRSRVAVVALPDAPEGDWAIDELIADPPELLLVIRRPPRSRVAQLLPAAMLRRREPPPKRAEPGLLHSRTTRRTGLVTAIDVAPTVLQAIGVEVPSKMRGRPISVRGKRDVATLRKLDRRLRVVPRRRYPGLMLVFGSMLVAGFVLRRRGERRRALRIAGLTLLWTPLVTLAAAALAFEKTMEYALMALAPVGLAFLTDRSVSWPRAPAVPALGAVAAYCVDLAFGSPLIVRSILGPNPRFGARFYGIGNELEAILPVLALVGLAAVLGRRRGALWFGALMLVLMVFVGAGRLGADVGGVITIAAAGAAAVLVARGATASWRTLIVLGGACLAGLLALVGIDVVTGGDAHFTTTILGADGAGDLIDVFRRRTSLAFQSLMRGLMPVFTILVLIAMLVAWQRRDELFDHVRDRPAWAAALLGGVAAGVIGSLANDSGPTLLVFGAVMLAAAVAYLRGDPSLPAAQPDTAS